MIRIRGNPSWKAIVRMPGTQKVLSKKFVTVLAGERIIAKTQPQLLELRSPSLFYSCTLLLSSGPYGLLLLLEHLLAPRCSLSHICASHTSSGSSLQRETYRGSVFLLYCLDALGEFLGKF